MQSLATTKMRLYPSLNFQFLCRLEFPLFNPSYFFELKIEAVQYARLIFKISAKMLLFVKISYLFFVEVLTYDNLEH
uniref:Uncharacterized protein n=1 Tax=Dulem virus 31 TaxID=3145749 RepID=A0AAU8AU61_9VIRU